jgi:alpha-tubulin suppressor-like RCC1 family protein
VFWGDNKYGQHCTSIASIPSSGSVVAVSCGYRVMALTSDGKACCWGLNRHGECNAPQDIIVRSGQVVFL